MSNPVQYSESASLSRIAEGDERAFAAFYHHYYQLIFPFILKHLPSREDAEEVVQQTFLRAWLHRDKLADLTFVKAWLFKVATREYMNHIRNRQFYKEFQSIAIAGVKQLNFSLTTTANDYINYLRRNHDTEQVLLKEKGNQVSPAMKQYLTAMSFINYTYGSFQTPMMMQGYLGKKSRRASPMAIGRSVTL